MIVEHEIVTGDQTWQLGRRDLRLFVDRDRGIAGTGHALADLGEVVDGIEEKAFHGGIPVLERQCRECSGTATKNAMAPPSPPPQDLR